jgi:hypothetical protein
VPKKKKPRTIFSGALHFGVTWKVLTRHSSCVVARPVLLHVRVLWEEAVLTDLSLRVLLQRRLRRRDDAKHWLSLWHCVPFRLLEASPETQRRQLYSSDGEKLVWQHATPGLLCVLIYHLK